MLDLARAKDVLRDAEFVLGDALDPAAVLGGEPFDAVFMAYGIRNLAEPDAALNNIRALMKLGTPICFHEYSVKGNPRAVGTWTTVAWGIIIPSGWLAARHTRIYRYLWRSVLDFDSVAEFEHRLSGAKFIGVHTEPVDGWQKGIVHHFIARTPGGSASSESAAAEPRATRSAGAKGGRPPGALDRRAAAVTTDDPTLAGRIDPNAPKRVTVVGGGLAGVSAAVALAERGVAVTLHEAEVMLGGRLASWTDHLNDAAGGHEFQMERGFHAAFRMYYNLRSLLRKVDPALRNLQPLDDYPLIGPNGEEERFSGLPRTPPLNLAALLWRTPTFRLRDLRAAQRRLGGSHGVVRWFAHI